jgi:hypothetical protein
VLALNFEESNYNNAIDNFNTARNDLLKSKDLVSLLSDPSDNNSLRESVVAFVDNIFSIQSANAQAATSACEAAEDAETAKEAAYNAAKDAAFKAAAAAPAAGAAATLVTVPVTDNSSYRRRDDRLRRPVRNAVGNLSLKSRKKYRPPSSQKHSSGPAPKPYSQMDPR